MDELIIHPRVLEKHPQLTEEDVKAAWENAYYEALRPDSPNFPEYLWIGVDPHGREVEMVGFPLRTGGSYTMRTPLCPSGRATRSSKRGGVNDG